MVLSRFDAFGVKILERNARSVMLSRFDALAVKIKAERARFMVLSKIDASAFVAGKARFLALGEFGASLLKN